MNDLAALLDRLTDDPTAPATRVDLDLAVHSGRRMRRRRRAVVGAAGCSGLALALVATFAVLPDGASTQVPGSRSSASDGLTGGGTLTGPPEFRLPSVRYTPVPLDLSSCPDRADDTRFQALVGEGSASWTSPRDPLAVRASDETVTRAVQHALRCAFPQAAQRMEGNAWRWAPGSVGDVPLSDGSGVRIGWILSRAQATGETLRVTPSGSDEDVESVVMRVETDVRTEVPGGPPASDFTFDDGGWDWRSASTDEVLWRPTIGVPKGWRTTALERQWAAYLVALALVDTGVIPGDHVM